MHKQESDAFNKQPSSVIKNIIMETYNGLPLVEFTIDGDGFEVDAVAIVDAPAIKKNFQTFNEDFADSYNDYPEAAKENAKIALRWADENGWGECGTDVGKQRANQLAKGESISRETIARMAAFERHRQNSDKELGDGCGRLMWLAWGGDEGISWAQRKLKQIDKSNFSIQDEEKRIISGALMLADTPIYRNDKYRGEYYCKFSKDTIEKIAVKFFDKGFQKNVNFMHDGNIIDGFVMFESFISDKSRGVLPMQGYEDCPDGSWFCSFKVENEKAWQIIKEGNFKGFSVEGAFGMVEDDAFWSEFLDILKMALS